MISYSSSRVSPVRNWVLGVVAFVATGLVAACHDATAPDGPGVRILAPADSVFEGDTVRLAAQIVDAAGAEATGAPMTWSVSDTSIAQISADGTLAARRPGTVRILAQSGGARGTYDLTVGRLVVREVVTEPSELNLGRGDHVQISVRALAQGGREVTRGTVTFASDDPRVATIGSPDNFLGRPGFLVANGPGSTTIRATVDGVSGTTQIGVVIADTLFTLTHYNGVPLPALVASDSVDINGVREFDEVYADTGSFVLSGLLQERYTLRVRYSQYHVFRTGDTVQRELRFQFVGEIDHGLVTAGADGSLAMLSEFIGPHLEHTAALTPDGYLVHFQEPGDDFVLDLRYKRAAP